MAYTDWPIERQFGNTIQWQYQLTGQGTPGSVSLKPVVPNNGTVLITTWTIESTGANTWDLPASAADITGVTYSLYINPPDETEEMNYIFPPSRATSQYGLVLLCKGKFYLNPNLVVYLTFLVLLIHQVLVIWQLCLKLEVH